MTALFLFYFWFIVCLFFFNYMVLDTLSSSFPVILKAALVTVAIFIQHIQYRV